MKSITTILILLSLSIGISWLAGSCNKFDRTEPLDYVSLEIPDGFPAPVQDFSGNRFSREGIELGRRLFYDGILSKDGNFPCSSCHQQIAGFGTYEHDRSHGYNNSHTLRNAPVLFNLAWADKFHWDGAFATLHDEAAQPITDPIEMAENFNDVIEKLKSHGGYRHMFRRVFGTYDIRPAHIQAALEQFTATLISANSKYDRFRRGEINYTSDELAGYEIYKQNCATCHPEPLFTDYSYRNIGLPVDPFLNDYGRMRITGLSSDSVKFKVPTLRNVDISSNYMHDGRFNTVQQVLNHYSTGVQQSPTLDPLMGSGISLTPTESNQLVRFLRTLTDSSFLKDPKFAKP